MAGAACLGPSRARAVPHDSTSERVARSRRRAIPFGSRLCAGRLIKATMAPPWCWSASSRAVALFWPHRVRGSMATAIIARVAIAASPTTKGQHRWTTTSRMSRRADHGDPQLGAAYGSPDASGHELCWPHRFVGPVRANRSLNMRSAGRSSCAMPPLVSRSMNSARRAETVFFLRRVERRRAETMIVDTLRRLRAPTFHLK